MRVEAQGSGEGNYTLRYSVVDPDAPAQKPVPVPVQEPEPQVVEKQEALDSLTPGTSEGSTDLPANTSTTGELPVGGVVTGEAPQRDKDWYRVNLVKGTIYVFAVKLTEVEVVFDINGEPNTAVSSFGLEGIYNSSGNRVRNPDGTDVFYFRPAQSGTFYVSVWYNRNSASYPQEAPYRLILVEDDYGGGNSTIIKEERLGTLGIGPGNGVSGEIGHIVKKENFIDKDSFAIQLDSGTQYRVTVSTPGSGGLKKPSVSLVGGSSYGIEGGRICKRKSGSGSVTFDYVPLHPTLEQIRRYFKQPKGWTGAASGMYKIMVTSNRSCLKVEPDKPGCTFFGGGRCFERNPNARGDCLGSYDLTVEEVTPTTLSETLCMDEDRVSDWVEDMLGM